jgi:hypothetical protein
VDDVCPVLLHPGCAPVYGEHGEEIRREYGFADDDIAAFEKDGTLVSTRSNADIAKCPL